MNKGISVVVCTYNSANRISQTLGHLLSQKLKSGVEWEIIVVDNNCTDNTVDKVKEASGTATSPNLLKIVREQKPGLSFARTAGIKAARFKYVVFCDDDNWLDASYLDIAYQVMESDTSIGALGGCSTAVSDVSFPDWFTEHQHHYAVGTQAPSSRDVTERGYLWGSGLIVQRDLFVDAFKKFPSLLSDRSGKELSSGGDTEICRRLILMGYKLYYDDRLKFQHFIDASRLTVAYREKLLAGFNKAHSTLHQYSLMIGIQKSTSLRKWDTLLKVCLKILKKKIYPFSQEDMQEQINHFYLLTGIKPTRNTSSEAVIIRSFSKEFGNARLKF